MSSNALHNSRTLRVLMVGSAIAAAVGTPAQVITPVVDPAFAGNYSARDIGVIPTSDGAGGLLFKDPNTLYVVSGASKSTAEIDAVTVVRGPDQHITGFSGSGVKVTSAPYADAGLQLTPDGVLFYAAYPINTLGQIRDRSTIPDKATFVSDFGMPYSVAGLSYVPPEFAAAGNLRLITWEPKGWYEGFIQSDGTGTYDITSVGASVNLPDKTEAAVYVGGGQPQFPATSVLLAAALLDAVYAYKVDPNGNPIVSTRTHFADISNAYGMAFDPVTGDLLVSTQLGTAETHQHITVVEGFTAVPEPRAWTLVAGVACCLSAVVFRSRNRFLEAA